MKQRLLFIFTILLNLGLIAQIEILKFDNIDIEDGLSDNHINSISEDKDGLIWIGTHHGLNLYDGANYTIYYSNKNDSTTISKNDVTTFGTRKNGDLMLGTWGEGCNFFNPETGVVERLPLRSNSSQNKIKSMLEDENGTIWIGTMGGGIYSYSPETKKFEDARVSTYYPNLEFNIGQEIIELNDKIWIASWVDGLAYLNKEKKVILPALLPDSTPVPITNIGEMTLRGEILFLGTTWGEVYSYNTVNGDFKKLCRATKNKVKTRITALTVDSTFLWISTENSLFKYNMSSDDLKEIHSSVNGTLHNGNFCSYKDSRNILWFGTDKAGLNKYLPNEKPFNPVLYDKNTYGSSNCLAQLDSNTFLLGTSDGILRYSTRDKTLKSINCTGPQSEIINHGFITDLEPYNSGFLVGSTNGLIFLSKSFEASFVQNKNMKKFSYSDIRSIYTYGKERHICGFNSGLLIMNTDHNIEPILISKEVTSDVKIPDDKVLSSYRINDQKILVGTFSGLYLTDLKNKTSSLVDLKEASNLAIWDIIESKERETLWLGIENGIAKYNYQAGEFFQPAVFKQANRQDIRSIIRNDDTLWVSSLFGVYSVNKDDNTIKDYRINDGLVTNSFPANSLFLSIEKQLFIAGGYGICEQNEHYTKTSRKNKNKAYTLNDLYINYKKVNPFSEVLPQPINKTKKLILEPHQNNISFNIGTLDYATTEGSTFGYSLIGFNKKFLKKKLNNSTIEYTNLPAGKYKLVVSSLDKYGKPIGDRKEIEIIVRAKIYTTWWFWSFVLFTISILTILYINYKRALHKKRETELEKKVQERTAQVANQKRSLAENNDKLALANFRLGNTISQLRRQKTLIESNIQYASFIQESLLPKTSTIINDYSNGFIIWKPKDTVSGDFYWHTSIDFLKITAVGDCTGHGVSGAFMSMMGINMLNLIVNEKGILQPNLILDELQVALHKAFKKTTGKVNDGMDITVTCYNSETKELFISSAMHQVIISSPGKKNKVIKGDRSPISGDNEFYNNRKPYTLHTLKLEPKTRFFLMTDGFQDQFHHTTEKKFMRRKLWDLIETTSPLSISEQGSFLENSFEQWKKDSTQTDDVLLIGLEV